MGSVSNRQFAGGCTKALEKMPEDEARAAEEPQLGHGAGICTWFNVHMGFGFLSMTARAGVALDPRWMSLCTRVSCTWRASGA